MMMCYMNDDALMVILLVANLCLAHDPNYNRSLLDVLFGTHSKRWELSYMLSAPKPLKSFSGETRTKKFILISSNDKGCDEVLYLNDDALVTLLVTKYAWRMIQINNWSLVDILFGSHSRRWALNWKWLAPMPLKGFLGEIVKPVYVIVLPVMLGYGPHATMMMIKFLIMKACSLYNAIIGPPNYEQDEGGRLNLPFKYEVPNGYSIKKICGKQVLMCKCYLQELKIEGAKVHTIERGAMKNIGPIWLV